MGGNCPEKFDINFYKNVILFNRKYRKQQYQILQENRDKNIIILIIEIRLKNICNNYRL